MTHHSRRRKRQSETFFNKIWKYSLRDMRYFIFSCSHHYKSLQLACSANRNPFSAWIYNTNGDSNKYNHTVQQEVRIKLKSHFSLCNLKKRISYALSMTASQLISDTHNSNSCTAQPPVDTLTHSHFSILFLLPVVKQYEIKWKYLSSLLPLHKNIR